MNNELVAIISAIIALLSGIMTGYLALKKTHSEQENTLALSDRNQNVELVKNLQNSNTETEKELRVVVARLQELQTACAEMRVKMMLLDAQKEAWQKEREAWQKERDIWQKDRNGFEKERSDWSFERSELTRRIKELERKLSQLEQDVKS